MMLKALLITAALAAGPAAKPRLSPRLTKALDAVSQAYYQGDSIAVWKALAPVADRLKDKQLKVFDAALSGRNIPSTAELLVDARMKLADLNRASALPAPKARERMMILAALGKRVDETLKSHAKDPLVTGTAGEPKTFQEYEERIHRIHVRRNIVATAKRYAAYAERLAATIPARMKKRLSPSARELVSASNLQRVNSVKKAEQELQELQMEIRLARLARGLEILKQPKLTKDRFLAAFTTGRDARILTAFLTMPTGTEKLPAKSPGGKTVEKKGELAAPKPITFLRETLNRPGLAKDISKQAEQAEQLAGYLGGKAKFFFEGLEWWFRGRFGRGPEVGGLAKSQMALNDPKLFVALNMPIELPEPVAPTNLIRLKITHVDRRHHYTWAWEDRRLQKKLRSDSSRGGSGRIILKDTTFHH